MFGVASVNGMLNRMFDDTRLSPYTLRVMSWNIGNIHWRWDSRASDDDLRHIVSVINQQRPHLVALQEVRDQKQLNRILVMLGPIWRGRLAHDSYDRYVAIVSRLDGEFSVLQTSTGRSAQALSFAFSGYEPILVVSIHLDAFDEKRRMHQAEELLASVKRIDPAMTFLAGDFNFDPSEAIQSSLDRQTYRRLTEFAEDAAKDQGPTTIIAKRLDYIFYRADDLKQVSARVLNQKHIKLMDHDPLLLDAVLKRDRFAF